MARMLVTSGPTRQYLDPVRYLTNASSGRMGAALAQAALNAGHDVTVISGPVSITYPPTARVVFVTTTAEMLQACSDRFPNSDGLIAAAAPCDFQPSEVASQKIAKSGEPLVLELTETPDILATLGTRKRANQWLVGFALETANRRKNAHQKLLRKQCDLMVLNSPEAIESDFTSVELIDRSGQRIAAMHDRKLAVAQGIIQEIHRRLLVTDRS